MRFDRPARRPCIICETPVGIIYELDVWLSWEEIAVLTNGRLMPVADRIYEPWLRVTHGAETETAAGIEIISQDDGA